MYYSVEEVSKQLNISIVTVYKKLKKINELKEHVKQFNNGKCITAEGIEIIRNSLQINPVNKPLENELKGQDGKQDNSIDLIVYKQLIESLEKQNNDLKQDKIKLYEQLEIKDKQLATKEEHTANLTRLLENSQVLLKQSQEKMLLLENPPVEKIPDKANSFWGKLNIFR